MKLSKYLLFLLPYLTFAQTDNKKLVDSLKYTTNVPYINPDHYLTKYGCGDGLFWKIVKQKKVIVPLLLNKLTDTTKTNTIIPKIGGKYTVADIAYAAIREIISEIPTFDQLLGLEVDTDGGRSHYWEHTKYFMHRESFQTELVKWYNKNENDLVWISSNVFLTCDCEGKHPSGGHYELKK
jgi:hypothetical protein